MLLGDVPGGPDAHPVSAASSLGRHNTESWFPCRIQAAVAARADKRIVSVMASARGSAAEYGSATAEGYGGRCGDLGTIEVSAIGRSEILDETRPDADESRVPGRGVVSVITKRLILGAAMVIGSPRVSLVYSKRHPSA